MKKIYWYYAMKNPKSQHEVHFCSKCKNKLRTIPATAEKRNLKFWVKSSEQNSSKCRTISKVHFASCLFTYNW